MAVNFEWDVSNCKVYSTKSGKSNVVHQVNYVIKATDDTNVDGSGNNYSAISFGRVYLDTSDLSSFTNWSDLTSSVVQGWVEANLGADNVAIIKTKLQEEISEKINPSSVDKILSS